MGIMTKSQGKESKDVADVYRSISVVYDKMKDEKKCLEYEMMAYSIYKQANVIKESICELCEWIANDLIKKNKKEAKTYLTELYGMHCQLYGMNSSKAKEVRERMELSEE